MSHSRPLAPFTRIPYAEAARRARRQDRIVYARLIAAMLIVVLLTFHRSLVYSDDRMFVRPLFIARWNLLRWASFHNLGLSDN